MKRNENKIKIDQNRLNHAIALFDELNSKDPNHELINGKEEPKELIYAQRVTTMLKSYVSSPSEILQLAARCQHIQRWKIKRKNFPMTKQGYHQWRTNLRELHAKIS